MKKLSLLFLCAPLLLAVAAGSPAPDFSGKNQNGKTVQLSDFKGKYLLLYFYPKDDTPGCTKEACSFRDQYEQIKKLGTAVVGVSGQDADSHQKFIGKHKLPFDLLVDSDGQIAKAFGVGLVPVIGFHKRQSVLVGPDGKVLKFYEKVDPDTHVAEVMADIKKAQQQP